MKIWLASGILRKILFAILVSSLVPLALLGIIALRGYTEGGGKAIARSKEALDRKSVEALELRAVEVANEIASFLYEREADLMIATLLPRTHEAYLSFYKAHQRTIWKLTDTGEARELVPLYREMAYIDATGQEIIKIVDGRLASPDELKDVSDPRNTTYKSETYFAETKKLAEGEIYVSHVTGYYVTKAEFEAGRRFEGVVRFATPLFDEEGNFAGMVMLALDSRHIEEFTAHIVPTEERFVVAPDPATGNYAYIIDDQGYTIAHPVDYLKTGLGRDGERLPYATRLEEIGLLPPRLDKMGFADENLASIHGRAIQGEAGSIQYYWAGHYKFAAYAPIPYYGGAYEAPAGFGWVGIAADVTKFHEAAIWVEEEINQETKSLIASTLAVIVVTVLFVLIIASLLARNITRPLLKLTAAAKAMEEGELSDEEIASFSQVRGDDEISRLSRVFASMAHQVQARERRLKQQVEELRIEIDEVKKARQVAEITETEYFRRLREHAARMRRRVKEIDR